MDIDQEELRNQRLQSPFEGRSKGGGKSDSGDGDSPSRPSAGSRIFPVLTVISLVIGLVLAGFAWKLKSDQEQTFQRLEVISQQISGLSESVNLIADRLEEDQEKLDSLDADIEVVSERLGVTTSELERARAVAERLREEQKKNVQALTDQIRTKADTQHVADLTVETDTKFEEVNAEISTVKEDVTASRQEIEKTWQELSSLGLQLTEHGELIATNAGGLDELRKRGERDYLEFDALKKRRIKVGDVIIELRKADTKRQRADLKLFYDDREVEKKQVYTNNPLTFYVGRDRVIYEFVINEVRKDEIRGYISVPKGVVGTAPVLGSSTGG